MTWSSSTPATATISNTAESIGLATALVKGTTVISAKLDAITGHLGLRHPGGGHSKRRRLKGAGHRRGHGHQRDLGRHRHHQGHRHPHRHPSGAEVHRHHPTHTHDRQGHQAEKGTKQQFVATGTFTDATTQDFTKTVTWTSAMPAIATISNAAGSVGQATAAATGATMISATSGGAWAAPTLTVNDGQLGRAGHRGGEGHDQDLRDPGNDHGQHHPDRHGGLAGVDRGHAGDRQHRQGDHPGVRAFT